MKGSKPLRSTVWPRQMRVVWVPRACRIPAISTVCVCVGRFRATLRVRATVRVRFTVTVRVTVRVRVTG